MSAPQFHDLCLGFRKPRLEPDLLIDSICHTVPLIESFNGHIQYFPVCKLGFLRNPICSGCTCRLTKWCAFTILSILESAQLLRYSILLSLRMANWVAVPGARMGANNYICLSCSLWTLVPKRWLHITGVHTWSSHGCVFSNVILFLDFVKKQFFILH